MLSNLFWRTKEGHDMPLKQVSVAEFRGLGPNEIGVPTLFAVWPTPIEVEAESVTEDKQTPPDWVLIEAAKRSGWDIDITGPDYLRERDYVGDSAYRALCDVIAEYGLKIVEEQEKQTPRDWVLIKAARLSDWQEQDIEVLRECYGKPHDATYTALCDMIERYETAPVDRKLLCAREAITQSHDLAFGSNIQQWQWIAIRAIELWESGYGL